MVSAGADLVLEVTVEPRDSIGYAMVYACHVQRVVQGRCTARTLLLTIMAGDHALAEIFAAKQPSEVFEAGFRKERDREPYAVMPLTGFVDEQRTSWKLVYVQ